MSNHLRVIIGVNDGIKVGTALVSQQGLDVVATTSRKFAVIGEKIGESLSIALRSDDARIVAEGSKISANLAYDTICDSLGEALYDADNKRLWIINSYGS